MFAQVLGYIIHEMALNLHNNTKWAAFSLSAPWLFTMISAALHVNLYNSAHLRNILVLVYKTLQFSWLVRHAAVLMHYLCSPYVTVNMFSTADSRPTITME